MPNRIVVRGLEWVAFFELRDYGAASDGIVEILGRRGVKPVLRENGRLLFAFESLAERERTWREAGEICRGMAVREITIFKTVSRYPASS